MTALPRWLWRSCTIIDYLKGADRAKACIDITKGGERRQLEIVVSTLAMAEVAKVDDPNNDDEARIKEFFSRDYIVAIPVDQRVAELARSLIQRHPGLGGADAVHFATAIMYRIPILETFDSGLLRLSQTEGNPVVAIRTPQYDGGEQLLLES